MSVKQAFLKSNTKCVNEVEEVDHISEVYEVQKVSVNHEVQSREISLGCEDLEHIRRTVSMAKNKRGSHRKYTEEDRVNIGKYCTVVYTGLLLQCNMLIKKNFPHRNTTEKETIETSAFR